tara:strand:- start:3163 stop:4875 length:1713 start_codon:yes stop_codon:yes gene_type:complete
MKIFFFRVDSSSLIGSGHVHRCINLAKYLKSKSVKCNFISKNLSGNLISKIKRENFEVFTLPNRNLRKSRFKSDYDDWISDTIENDIKDTIKILSKYNNIDYLIIDHYSLDIRWENKIRSYVDKIFVIEDLTSRKHFCDYLLNFNIPNNNHKKYSKLINPHAKILLGPKYLLLPKNFNSNKKNLNINRITFFIFFGYSDNFDLSYKTICYLERISNEKFFYNIVLGRSSISSKKIKNLLKDKKNFKIYISVNNILKIIKKSDIAISSGGFNSFERIRLLKPSLVINNAKNQNDICRSLSKYKLIEYIGEAKDLNFLKFKKSVKKIIQDYDQILNHLYKNKKLFPNDSIENIYNIIKKDNKIINILIDKNSWLNDYLGSFIKDLRKNSYIVNIHYEYKTLNYSLCTFILSFSNKVPYNYLSLSNHNIVIHESSLPQGRGWSPLTWQILEGKTKIPISLFSASKEIDSGKIYMKDIIITKKIDLIDDLRLAQASKTFDLCKKFLRRKNFYLYNSKNQTGKPSYYTKRKPEDNELDINASLKDNFDLLRVSDFNRYPAYFMLENKKFKIKIEK